MFWRNNTQRYILICVLLAITAKAFAEYRLIPERYSFAVDTSLYPWWNGSVHIDSVQISSSGGPVRLVNLILLDSVGRPWFTADRIDLFIQKQAGARDRAPDII